MDQVITYTAGKPSRRINADAVLDEISDQVLSHGDVEKALQRVFRFGTEDDLGLLDVLDRLREEIQDGEHSLQDPDQHTSDMESGPSRQRVEDKIAMREALRQVESLDDLQGIDPQLMQRSLTADELNWVEKWADMKGQMVESGLVSISGPRLVLTAKALRHIGSRLLQHIFVPPTRRGRGDHLIHRPGPHGMAGEEISSWEWGKPLDLHIGRSIANAVRRVNEQGKISLRPDDFEVFDREAGAAVATILLIDMSRSMFESGAWHAAKRAAIALNTLVTASKSHDQLKLVGFSGDARQIRLDELPLLSWDQFSHGTNLHAGLLVASQMLQQHRGMNRHVVIITDGEPTAFMDGSTPVFEHPVTERTPEATLREARRLSRQGISFTTICVGDSAFAPEFARILSRTVNGRMILLPLDELGTFVVRDIAQGTHRAIR